MAGAAPKVVTLRPPDWSFDPDEWRAAITPRTRLVLLNTPHNPTGKVFADAELDLIATTCVERDLLAVTDEVYEHLVFDGHHRPLAGWPGMADRTLTISSAGKTFSFTGWKIGWACGPAPLVAAVRAAKQFLTYAGGTPFQYAVAAGLAAGPALIDGLVASLRERRDLFCDGLEALGLADVPPGRHLLRHDGRRRRSASRTRWRSAGPCRPAVASSRCRARSSTSTRPRVHRSSAGPSASGRRCSPTRSSA